MPQHMESGQWVSGWTGLSPIAVSWTLSKTEKNYGQIDKEGLYLIYEFRNLYGRKFVLVTGHKPLITLFGLRKGIPPLAAARLQRWALLLSAYPFMNWKFLIMVNAHSKWPEVIEIRRWKLIVTALVVCHQLLNFLFTYWFTPHATTNEPPCQLFMGRMLRNWYHLLYPSADKSSKQLKRQIMTRGTSKRDSVSEGSRYI